MFKCKMNFHSQSKFKTDVWKCDSCESEIDTQSHILFCPAYTGLREGKNIDDDKDLVKYIVDVMKIREKLGFMK